MKARLFPPISFVRLIGLIMVLIALFYSFETLLAAPALKDLPDTDDQTVLARHTMEIARSVLTLVQGCIAMLSGIALLVVPVPKSALQWRPSTTLRPNRPQMKHEAPLARREQEGIELT